MEELKEEDYVVGIRLLMSKAGRKTETASRKTEESDRERNVCLVCGHMWNSSLGMSASRCPSCKSTRWNDSSAKKHTCRCCGHKWISKTDNPVRCPSCRTKLWNADVTMYVCGECRHTMAIKDGFTPPAKCPKCSSGSLSTSSAMSVCPKCGHVGRTVTPHGSKCRFCGATMSNDSGSFVEMPRKATPFQADEVLAKMLADSSNEETCINALSESTGMAPIEATVVYRYYHGEPEFAIARDMNLSLDSVIRTVLPLRNAGIRSGSVRA